MNLCGVCRTFKDRIKVFLELTLFLAAEYLAMKDQMLITLYTSTGLIWCEQVSWDWNFLRRKITNGDRYG